MPIAAILLAALLQGSSPDNSIALSVSARPNPVSLSESVTLVITLTNQSDAPRYVHRDVDYPFPLEFWVLGPDGKPVRWFADPPPPPPFPKHAGDLVRIDGRRAFRCFVEVPLADLGIRRAGVFSVTGFWHGVSLKAPEVDLGSLVFSFSYSEPLALTVTKAGRRGQGLQPQAPAPSVELPKCAAAAAGRSPV